MNRLLSTLVLLASLVVTLHSEAARAEADSSRQLVRQHEFLTRYAEIWAQALPRFRNSLARDRQRYTVMTPQLRKVIADYGDDEHSSYPGIHSEMIIEILSAGSPRRRKAAEHSISVELENLRTALARREEALPVDEETVAAFESLAAYWDTVGKTRSDAASLIESMTRK